MPDYKTEIFGMEISDSMQEIDAQQQTLKQEILNLGASQKTLWEYGTELSTTQCTFDDVVQLTSPNVQIKPRGKRQAIDRTVLDGLTKEKIGDYLDKLLGNKAEDILEVKKLLSIPGEDASLEGLRETKQIAESVLGRIYRIKDKTLPREVGPSEGGTDPGSIQYLP